MGILDRLFGNQDVGFDKDPRDYSLFSSTDTDDIPHIYYKALLYYYVLLLKLFIRILNALSENNFRDVDDDSNFEFVFLVKALIKIQNRQPYDLMVRLPDLIITPISFHGLENLKGSKNNLLKTWANRQDDFQDYLGKIESKWDVAKQHVYELPKDLIWMLEFWGKEIKQIKIKNNKLEIVKPLPSLWHWSSDGREYYFDEQHKLHFEENKNIQIMFLLLINANGNWVNAHEAMLNNATNGKKASIYTTISDLRKRMGKFAKITKHETKKGYYKLTPRVKI